MSTDDPVDTNTYPQVRSILHDIRNDLCIVMGGLDMLTDHPNLTPQGGRAVSRANEGIDRLNNRLKELSALLKDHWKKP